MNPPEHITCPCCATSFSSVDAPIEYARVKAWSPGRALANRNKGKTRNISEATRQARIATLAKWRASQLVKGSNV